MCEYLNMSTLTILFLSVSIQFSLPPRLLESLCYVESKHDVSIVHKNDGGSSSIGVCQVKLKTAKAMGFKGTEKELLDPENNVFYAGKYLAYQINRYHTNLAKAVIAYNKGNAKDLTATKYQVKVFKQWRLCYK